MDQALTGGTRRLHIGLAFAGAALIGLAAGAEGVLLKPQIEYYRIDKSLIGLIFFAMSAGYLVAGGTTGLLLRRFGARGILVVGTGVLAAAALGCATQPPYRLLVAVTVVLGFGAGTIDAAVNAYLAELPEPTSILNMLHAFFGVGALAGPVLATVLLDSGLDWGAVYVALAVLSVPLLVTYARVYPGRVPADPHHHEEGVGSPLSATLRHRPVLLATVFLIVYVGAEASVGNWAYLFVIEDRGLGPVAAGWVVSGFWIGLTVGRFVLAALAERFGVGPAGLAGWCLAGLGTAALAVWAAPVGPVAVAGLVLIGAFLGPIFPLTIAVLPRLAPPRLVPTAIGILVGASVIGGSVFPWLAGVLADRTGLWSLMPYTVMLALLMALTWRSVTARLSG